MRHPRHYHRRTGPSECHAPIPHVFWALVGEEKISGAVQLVIMGYLMARTWGDPDKFAQVRVTVPEMARDLKLSVKAIEPQLADLRDRGMIGVEERGKIREYWAKPDNWDHAPKYEAEADADEADADEADADEADADEADADEADAPKVSAGDPLVVLPGKRSRVVPLRFLVSGVADPVELKLDYRNECPDLPLAFSASGGPTGRFCVTVRRAEVSAVSCGDEKANGYPAATGDSQTDGYREYLAPLVIDRWGKALDAALLSRVVAAANGAPLEVYERLVYSKLKADSGRRHTPGILIELAKDAAKAHDAATRLRAVQQPAGGTSRGDLRATMREFAVSDPTEYERMREQRVAMGEAWPTLAELGIAS